MMRETTLPRSGPNRSIPAARREEAGEAGRAAWLLCRAGGILCALPIEHVVETMRPLPIEPIAGAPPYVLGLSVMRGTPVPVVDLGLIVGVHSSSCTRLIAVRTAARTIALAVETVMGVSALAAETSRELPPLLREAATDTVAAVGALDRELIVFLSAARLVPESTLALLDGRGAVQ